MKRPSATRHAPAMLLFGIATAMVLGATPRPAVAAVATAAAAGQVESEPDTRDAAMIELLRSGALIPQARAQRGSPDQPVKIGAAGLGKMLLKNTSPKKVEPIVETFNMPSLGGEATYLNVGFIGMVDKGVDGDAHDFIGVGPKYPIGLRVWIQNFRDSSDFELLIDIQVKTDKRTGCWWYMEDLSLPPGTDYFMITQYYPKRGRTIPADNYFAGASFVGSVYDDGFRAGPARSFEILQRLGSLLAALQ